MGCIVTTGRLKGTAAEEKEVKLGLTISSSADKKIGYNEDLLMEILVRLPISSLVRFISVSKQWCSLIKNPNFILRRRRRNPNHPVEGIFLWQPPTTNQYLLVLLDYLENNLNPIKIRPLKFKFKFPDNLKIVESRNGLLLCRRSLIKKSNGRLLLGLNRFIKKTEFYLYNPTINQSTKLPQPLHPPWVRKKKCFLCTLSLAFDPCRSPHYKVIASVIEEDHGDYGMIIEIYSSVTGRWKFSSQHFPYNIGHVVYCNGSLFFITSRDVIFYYHVDDDITGYINIDVPPQVFLGETIVESDLLVSGDDHLLFVRTYPLVHKFYVSKLEKDYSRWSTKFIVDLSEVATIFTGSCLTHSTSNLSFRTLVVGERDEDSFLLVELPGKLVKYYITSKNFHKLCDLNPEARPMGRPVCRFLGGFKCDFDFIPSLASL